MIRTWTWMMGDCHMIQDLYFTMWMAINPQNPPKIFKNFPVYFFENLCLYLCCPLRYFVFSRYYLWGIFSGSPFDCMHLVRCLHLTIIFFFIEDVTRKDECQKIEMPRAIITYIFHSSKRIAGPRRVCNALLCICAGWLGLSETQNTRHAILFF